MSGRFVFESDPRKVVDLLTEIAKSGERVVPFLGSGLSAPSGIMMGQDFMNYLATVIRYAVTSDGAESVEHVRMLREGVWKQAYSQGEVRETLAWVRAEVGSAADGLDGAIQDIAGAYHAHRLGAHGSEEPSRCTVDYITSEGIRSLRDWRSALDFLSRLIVDDGVVVLRADREPSDQIVTDAFVRQLVAKRMPNLAHKMIAHVSSVMNVRLLLTTNFDDLIERAFRALNRELHVVEVPLGARLPPARVLDMGRALVKLHGGLIQTRADASLDMLPDAEDIDAFVSYLTPGTILASTGGAVWLLVIGFSGTDRRCIDMMKAGLRRRERLRILWIAHSRWDIARAERIFSEPSVRSLIGAGQENRLRFALCERPDLLLYEMFQRSTRSLPSGGLAYRFAYKLPPVTEGQDGSGDRQRGLGHGGPSRQDQDLGVDETTAAILRHLALGRDDDPLLTRSDGRSLHVILRKSPGLKQSWTLVVGGSGAMRIASSVFDRLESPVRKVWFELQEYSGFGALLLDLVRTFAIRSGVFQQELLITPSAELLDESPEKFESQMRRILKRIAIIPEDWMLFLYAREQLGGSAGWVGAEWLPEDIERLVACLGVLGNLGFHTVLIPTTRTRIDRGQEKASSIRSLLTWWVSGFSSSDVLNALAAEIARKEKLGLRDAERRATDLMEVLLPVSGEGVAASRLKMVGAILERLRGSFDNLQKERARFAPLIASDIDDISVHAGSDGAPGSSARVSPRILRRGGLGYSEYLAKVLAWIHEPASKSPRHRKDDPWRRQKFIFAISLFRQSRHECAFYSEAVFPCPYPFNAASIDNDEDRAGLVRGWVKDLEVARVVYTRPGGFFWMHRDVRLGLQAILGECHVNTGKPHGDISLERHSRARTHLWIGQWYMRSFLASRHTVPFWSAIYHFIEAARFAPYERPRFLAGESGEASRMRYRRHIADLGLRSASNAAVLGRSHTKYWTTSGDVRLFQQVGAYLVDIDGEVQRGLRRIRKRSEGKEARDHAEHLFVMARNLSEEFDSLGRSVAAECGRVGRDRVPGGGKGLRIGRRSTTLPSENLLPGVRWSFGGEDFYSDRPHEVDFLHQFLEPARHLGIKWIWGPIRECLSLGTPEGDRLDLNAPLKLSRERHLAEQAAWLDRHRGREALVLGAVHVLGEIAYACMRRAKVLNWYESLGVVRSSSGVGESGALRSNTVGKWVAASWLVHYAIDLSRSLGPDRLSDHVLEVEKLSTLYGLSLAALGRFGEARRRLGEAASLLSITGAGRGVRHAPIFIRSAEAFVYEAKALADGSSSPEDGPSARSQAALSAAWLALEDGEAALSGSSHSTLWWGLIYRLRLRVARGLRWRDVGERISEPRSRDDRAELSKTQLDDMVWSWVEAGLSACGNSYYRQLRVVSAFLDTQFLPDGGIVDREIQSGSPLWGAIEAARRDSGSSAISAAATHLQGVYMDWIEKA